MIDLHCHILPGVDDGPSNSELSLEMVKQAVSLGITDVFATPHHLNGQFENTKTEILHRIVTFNSFLQQENISITVHPGQEIRIHQKIFTSLEQDELLTLGNRGQYLLLELPSNEVPTYTQTIIYELILKGITPIIVHPERNKILLQNVDILVDLVMDGALVQLTAGSMIGHFGKKVKQFSEKIIQHQLVHFIASDAHNTSSRGNYLKEAYEVISKLYGIELTYYFRENAILLLNGNSVHKEKPIPFRRKVFGIF